MFKNRLAYSSARKQASAVTDILSLAWPIARLHEAIDALAHFTRLTTRDFGTGRNPLAQGLAMPLDAERLDICVTAICGQLGIECESVDSAGVHFEALLRGAGPAVVHYRHADQHYVLLLIKAKATSIRLLDTDLHVVDYPSGALNDALSAEAKAPVLRDVKSLLGQATLDACDWRAVEDALVRQAFATKRLGGCWLLRLPPTDNFWAQLRHAHLHYRLLGTVGTFIVLYLLELAGWTLIGQGALGGRLDPGWLVAWTLLLMGMVPLRAISHWLQGSFAIEAGGLLKQRLLAGALQLNIDAIRQQGVGQLLSRVIESQALEALALNGGFNVLTACVELSLATWVLTLGAGGLWHATLLVVWLIATANLCWRYYQRLRHWTNARRDLTHDLIERMVGHRTRIAQEAPAARHSDEDPLLTRYLMVSNAFDTAFVIMAGGIPRGWLLVGLAGLAPAFIANGAETTGLAIGLGGVLLAYRAFGEVASGLAGLARALIAWEQVRPFVVSSKSQNEVTSPAPVVLTEAYTDSRQAPVSVLLQARNLGFSHRDSGTPVLENCDLTINRGDRILLEGSSGGGKSTLAALLVGLRQQDSGVLLLNGLDRATLGKAWSQWSTAAPQFHENHVLSGTLAFNLLMGRSWPPSNADLAEAEAVCHELGLGELLARMPSGLMQMVGETGWQLSHGERSRLYLARALLQRSELIVLDETFAALDPETLEQCLHCTLNRAATLLVIAHP